MPSLFGSILTSIGGEMKAKEDSAAEDAKWAKRQILMNKLQIDQDKALGKNKRKRGNTDKINGAWMTAIEDGNGDIITHEPATASEIAAVESNTSLAENNKASATLNTNKARDYEGDHARQVASDNLSMDATRQNIASSRSADARGWASINQSKDSLDTGINKEKSEVREMQQEVISDLASIGTTESDNLRVALDSQLRRAIAQNASMSQRKALLAEYKGKAANLKARATSSGSKYNTGINTSGTTKAK